MLVNQFKIFFKDFKSDEKLELQSIFGLSLVVIGVYYTYLSMDEFVVLGNFTHYIVSAIILSAFLLALFIPSFKQNIANIYLFSSVLFMFLLIYWLHLNGFKRYMLLSYWLSIVFIGLNFKNKDKLFQFLIIIFVGLMISIGITAESEIFKRYLWWFWSPIFMYGVYTILNYNLTIQQRMQEKEILLGERERELDYLYNGLPAIIVCKDKNNRIIKVNQAYADLTDKTLEELNNIDLFEVYPKNIAQKYYEQDLEIINTGQPKLNMVEKQVTPSGKTHWIRSNKTPVYDHDGAIVGLMIIGFDITKEIEEKQQRKILEERSQRIFHEAPYAMALTDLNGRFVQVNAAFANLLGYQKAELINRPTSPLTVYPMDSSNTALLESNDFHSEVVQFNKKDGQSLMVDLTVNVIRGTEGQPQFILSMIEDLTQAEEFKAKLDQYAKALETSNKELEQFAYIASHDLKEPLRMIKSYIQLIKRRYNDRLDDAGREFMAYAVDGVDRMDLLLRDLLGYSRAGRVQLDKTFITIDDILMRVTMNLRLQINETNADISTDADIPPLFVNRMYISLLFQNLINNAIKYKGDKDPNIKIEAKLDGNMIQFAISDNGIGIEEKFLTKIFLIFQRLHAHHEYSGTGVGLAICKRIVERHGGKIWATSKVGVGSIIHFTLPHIEQD